MNPLNPREFYSPRRCHGRSSTTRKYGGSGLGLAISARLVKLMGGRIWLESVEGKGSTFHFTVPFELQPTQEEVLASGPLDQLKELPVLVVDDNETNCRILCQMTTRWGMRPTAAADGAAALTAIDEAEGAGHPFAVILTDALMPNMDGYQLSKEIRRRSGSNQAKILMLASGGQRGDAEHCRQSGISAYLLKPVMKADLQDAILTLLHRDRSNDGVARPLVTRHMLRQSSRKLHILVAEDNAVNQAVILRILEKMGHTSVLAQNGKVALSLATSEKFDLAFMDVQMPEMDGLAATRAIRQHEEGKGMRLPIFAMTARAMKGDRERCLESGMDGYITKPIRFGDIEKTLSDIPAAPAGPAPVKPFLPANASGKRPWCKDEVLQRLGGDEALLQEVCRIFLKEAPKLIQTIKNGIAGSDPEAVLRAAHTLKGELGYLGNAAATRAVLELEDIGREKKLDRGGEVLHSLEREVNELYQGMAETVGAAS